MEYISRSIAASEKIFNGLLMCGLIVKIGSLFELVGMVITADCEEVLGNVVKVLKFGGVMLWLDNREIDDGGGIFRYQDAVVESSVGRVRQGRKGKREPHSQGINSRLFI